MAKHALSPLPDVHQWSKVAVNTSLYEDRSVQHQLASVTAEQQEKARACLLQIIGGVQSLAMQGLALQGHDSGEGNLD